MAICRSDLAQRVRDMVPARDAAERYGFTLNRAGYICCPFHNERTPSLKLFPDGGWKCFGCGNGGSSIDFVMLLFDLNFQQAVVRLDMDFSLNLTGERPTPAARSAVLEERRRKQKQRTELENEVDRLTKEHYRLHRNRQLYEPDGPSIEPAFHPLFVEALQKLPEVQHRLWELENEIRRTENGQRAAMESPAARVYSGRFQIRKGV